tara:strand:- start:6 stop:314 length:309 start_codon:yes stop_codon:yes gene_type:complete
MESTPISKPGTSTDLPSAGELYTELSMELNTKLKPWQIEQGKAEFTNFLYDLFDRDNAPIGLRGTYTGLWDQFKKLECFDPLLPTMIKNKFILDTQDANTKI